MTDKQLEVGDRVIYKPHRENEAGTVKGHSDDPELVFVVYDGDTYSKATRVEDLVLEQK